MSTASREYVTLLEALVLVPREEVLLLFALASVAYGECRNPRSPSRAAMKSLIEMMMEVMIMIMMMMIEMMIMMMEVMNNQ